MKVVINNRLVDLSLVTTVYKDFSLDEPKPILTGLGTYPNYVGYHITITLVGGQRIGIYDAYYSNPREDFETNARNNYQFWQRFREKYNRIVGLWNGTTQQYENITPDYVEPNN